MGWSNIDIQMMNRERNIGGDEEIKEEKYCLFL